MIIKNFEKLATSVMRKQALLVAEEGYKAVNTTRVVRRQVSFDPSRQVLRVCGKKFGLSKYSRVFLVGIGKAALEAAQAVSGILKDKITAGYVIDVKTGDLPSNIVSRAGTHPLPSEQNVVYTRELLNMLKVMNEDDLVLCVVSGGGSSLFTDPYTLPIQRQIEIFKTLTKLGASIMELNTVRKHLDLVKGGNLARLVRPATLVSLVFSDVPGDDLSMVASGPTIKDFTTSRNALDILYKYGALGHLDLDKLMVYETPKEDMYFKNVHNFLAVSAKAALQAMSVRAEDLGFDVKIYSDRFQGEARELGAEIVKKTKRGECLLGAGESTVHISGQGVGGRNQEMALGGLSSISHNQVLVCLASDGHDNTDAAGAIVDSLTKHKAAALGLDAENFLQHNDSYHFFESVDDLVFTDLTGSNVADFFVCLRQ